MNKAIDKEHLKQLLKELKRGDVDAATKEKAKAFLQTIDAAQLGLLEQELINEGVSHEEIRGSLCDIHLDMMRDSLVAKKREVESPHPIHTLMEEHKVILKTLSELGDFIKRLQTKKSFDDLGKDKENLKDIAHHLVEAESHHQREEEVLFPKLEKHGISEPPNIMRMDHVEFRKRKERLYQIAHNPDGRTFKEYQKEVVDLGEYLTKQLESHIFKEDNILYQIALEVLTKEEWNDVKKECDKIGYCCFTPEDVNK